MQSYLIFKINVVDENLYIFKEFLWPGVSNEKENICILIFQHELNLKYLYA